MKKESNRRIAACAVDFALPRYEELPSVGLYLDQTVQFVNGYFRSFQGVELTASMVSNYVKKGIISHPVKKKYTREQLASLIYIVVSKTVLSMDNRLTIISATSWRTVCPTSSACATPSGTLPKTPGRKSCCSAAPSSPPPTRCIWTVPSPSCGRRKPFGRAFSPTSPEDAVFDE